MWCACAHAVYSVCPHDLCGVCVCVLALCAVCLYVSMYYVVYVCSHALCSVRVCDICICVQIFQRRMLYVLHYHSLPYALEEGPLTGLGSRLAARKPCQSCCCYPLQQLCTKSVSTICSKCAYPLKHLSKSHFLFQKESHSIEWTVIKVTMEPGLVSNPC